MCWEGCWLCSRWRVLSLEEVPMRFMIRNFHNRWRLNPFHFSLNCQWICCPQRLHGFHKTDQLTCLCSIILPWCVQPKVRLLWKLRLGRVSAWSCISCPGMRTLGLITDGPLDNQITVGSVRGDLGMDKYVRPLDIRLLLHPLVQGSDLASLFRCHLHMMSICCFWKSENVLFI